MSKEVINSFYTAFKQLDSSTMIACYHDDIVFTDPAFGTLKGTKAKAMWQMLCKNAIELTVSFNEVEANHAKGSAHWEARYIFRTTGRKVHNKIDAEFEFKDGLIIKHTDSFNLHTWARQAMGFKGLLLGGTSFFKKKLQAQTNRLLDNFNKSQL